MLAPHMEAPEQFCAELKNWLLSYDPKSELTITYHFYKIQTLYDLFSATLRELTGTNRTINTCIHCRKPFVTINRSDQKYCPTTCKETHKKELARCSTLCRKVRNRLDIYCKTSDDYENFIKANAIHRENARKGVISTTAYFSWLEEEYQKTKKK